VTTCKMAIMERWRQQHGEKPRSSTSRDALDGVTCNSAAISARCCQCRGDVGHAGLLVADAGKQGDGRVEDRLAPRSRIQTFAAWSVASADGGMLRQRAHNIDPDATKFIGLFLTGSLAKTKFSLD